MVRRIKIFRSAQQNLDPRRKIFKLLRKGEGGGGGRVGWEGGGGGVAVAGAGTKIPSKRFTQNF
jgi:hypothetical protein